MDTTTVVNVQVPKTPLAAPPPKTYPVGPGPRNHLVVPKTPISLPVPKIPAPGPKTSSPGPRTLTPGTKTSSPGPKTSSPGPKTSSPGPKTSSPGPKTSSPGPKHSTKGSSKSSPHGSKSSSHGSKSSSHGSKRSSHGSKRSSHGSKSSSHESNSSSSHGSKSSSHGSKSSSQGGSKTSSPGKDKNKSPGSKKSSLGPKALVVPKMIVVPKTTLVPKTTITLPITVAVTKTPVAVSKTPVTVIKTPVAVSKTPVTVTKTPVAVSKTPVTVTKTPVAVSKTPVAVAKTPVAVTKTPAAVTKTPVAVTKTPVAVTKTTAAVTKTPVVVPKTTSGVSEVPTTTPALASPQTGAASTKITLTSTKTPLGSPKTIATPVSKAVGAVPHKLFKSHSNCFICYRTFENSSLAATNEFEVPLQLKLFEVYSQLLNLQNVKWNLKTDGYPFCPSCVVEINNLAELKDQILSLQKSIDVILKSTQCSILISRSTIKNPRVAKNLKKIDYLRNMAVKEFEPTVTLFRWGEPVPVVNKVNPVTPLPELPPTTTITPIPTPVKSKPGELVKTEALEAVPPSKSKRKLTIKKKEKVGNVTAVQNSTIRLPKKLNNSPRVQPAIVPKPMSKGVLPKSQVSPNIKEDEVETIDLSSDDELADPNFSASDDSEEDQYELQSEKSWIEDSVGSSSNLDGMPIRRSSRTKRKSIKMIEADNDNSQGDNTTSQNQPANKRPKLSIEREKHKCGDCASSYTSRKLLMKHMLFTNHRPYDEVVSKDSNEENRSNIESDPEEGENLIDRNVEDFPFECKKCWTRHATINKLRRHEIDHYGKQSFKCTRGNCQLSFTEKSLLTDHIRKVHENEDEQSLLAFMDTSQDKKNHLDIDFSFLDEPPLRNLPSPTPEECFRIIEDDPMFRLDIDEPIIRPEEHEPMSFDNINYQDSTLIDYSDGNNFNFFDPLTHPQGIYYM